MSIPSGFFPEFDGKYMPSFWYMQIISQVFFIFFAYKFLCICISKDCKHWAKKENTTLYILIGIYINASISFVSAFGLLGVVCAFVDDVCANLGVTFLKTQTISPLQALNPWIIAYYLPLLKVLIQVKTHQKHEQTRTTKGTASRGKLCICPPNPIHSNYTKSRFFAVLVSENTGKTLLRTYKKAHFGAFWHLWGQTKGAKGGGPEYLNAPATATTSTKITGMGQI